MPSSVTRLTGTGPLINGYIAARPLTPWAVWTGTVSRPCPLRFKITDGEITTLSGGTAYIPITHVPEDAEGPCPIVFPHNNLYYIELIQRGRSVMQAYWEVPFDPEDEGKNWFEVLHSIRNQTYTLDARYPEDSLKTYDSIVNMEADLDNVLVGTLVYCEEDENFYGRAASEWRITPTPPTVPTAPTLVSLTFGNAQLTAAFTAPSSNGGATITDYEYRLDGGSWVSAGTTSSPFVISGLTNGTEYDVEIRAVNSVGGSPESNLLSETPRTVPSAPTITAINSGSGELEVVFTAGSNGGSAITNYQYRLDGGSFVSAGTTTSPFTISGLTNGVEYDIEIRAINAVGNGAISNLMSGTPEVTIDAILDYGWNLALDAITDFDRRGLTTPSGFQDVDDASLALKWQDLSGNGYHVYGTDRQPIIQYIDGHKAVHATFPAGGHTEGPSFSMLHTAATLGNIIGDGSAYTILIVGRVLSNHQALCPFIADPSSGLTLALERLRDATTIRFRHKDSGGFKVVSRPYTLGEWFVAVARYDGTNIKLRIDDNTDDILAAGTLVADGLGSEFVSYYDYIEGNYAHADSLMHYAFSPSGRFK
jgi:hypothetical protein